MSHRAVIWALHEAPEVPTELVITLVALADRADPHGRNAYPSAASLARVARKSPRQIRRDLVALEKAGLIRRGDQSRLHGVRPQYRPIVWDLAMSDRTPTSPLDRTWEASRGDTGDHLDRTPTSYKLSLNQKKNQVGGFGKSEYERFVEVGLSRGYELGHLEQLWAMPVMDVPE